MKSLFTRCATLALATFGVISLMGCGGGGTQEDDDITRELLAGSSEKTWTLRSIKGNANFEGGGVDTPCPASLPVKEGFGSFACGSADKVIMRNSGTFNYRGINGISWNLSGSTLTLDLGSFGVITADVIRESDTQLRVRQLSRVKDGVRDTDEDGCELVIQEGIPI